MSAEEDVYTIRKLKSDNESNLALCKSLREQISLIMPYRDDVKRTKNQIKLLENSLRESQAENDTLNKKLAIMTEEANHIRNQKNAMEFDFRAQLSTLSSQLSDEVQYRNDLEGKCERFNGQLKSIVSDNNIEKDNSSKLLSELNSRNHSLESAFRISNDKLQTSQTRLQQSTKENEILKSSLNDFVVNLAKIRESNRIEHSTQAGNIKSWRKFVKRLFVACRIPENREDDLGLIFSVIQTLYETNDELLLKSHQNQSFKRKIHEIMIEYDVPMGGDLSDDGIASRVKSVFLLHAKRSSSSCHVQLSRLFIDSWFESRAQIESLSTPMRRKRFKVVGLAVVAMIRLTQVLRLGVRPSTRAPSLLIMSSIKLNERNVLRMQQVIQESFAREKLMNSANIVIKRQDALIDQLLMKLKK